MNCIYEAENTIRGKIQMRIAVCDDDEQSFVLKNRDGIARIVFARLEYAEVINKKVSFYLTDGVVREVTAALADFEEKLLARPEFLKVHRSYIVNLNCVQSVGGGNIVTVGGRSVPVARKRWSQVQEACMHFLLHKKELQTETPEDAGVRSEGPWRILLVDDEEAERERWADVLRSRGCEVRLAADGEEALEKAAQGPCDCVLLDVMLHGEDTFLLCGQLGSLAQAPVIFLSCLTGTEEQMKGLRRAAWIKSPRTRRPGFSGRRCRRVSAWRSPAPSASGTARWCWNCPAGKYFWTRKNWTLRRRSLTCCSVSPARRGRSARRKRFLSPSAADGRGTGDRQCRCICRAFGGSWNRRGTGIILSRPFGVRVTALSRRTADGAAAPEERTGV